jgi:hypothetical protein
MLESIFSFCYFYFKQAKVNCVYGVRGLANQGRGFSRTNFLMSNYFPQADISEINLRLNSIEKRKSKLENEIWEKNHL